MFNETMKKITERIIEDPGVPISYEQACELAAIPDGALDLVVCAGKVREKYKKNKVFTCSIINAKSGFCSEDCAFCAQSAHHKTGVKTYPLLSKEEMVGEAVRMQEAGATKYSMVTSGFMLEECPNGALASAPATAPDTPYGAVRMNRTFAMRRARRTASVTGSAASGFIVPMASRGWAYRASWVMCSRSAS